MSRKQKAPPEKPSKAYLVSFGDTMTALLAFFIVLNSFAKEQTGANMYSGTGSFMNSMSSIGLSGGSLVDRSARVVQKKAPSPIYAVSSPDPEKDPKKRLGPDEDPDNQRVIDRQIENFKRFLTDVEKDFDVDELPPTKSQLVFDSFEKFRKPEQNQVHLPLQKNAIQTASEAIMRLGREDFRMEIIVWADMPGKVSLVRSMETAAAVHNQIDSIFNLTDAQRSRFTVSSKPWLFADALRPKMSIVISKLDVD